MIDNHGRDADGKRKCEIAKEGGRRKNRIGYIEVGDEKGYIRGTSAPGTQLDEYSWPAGICWSS